MPSILMFLCCYLFFILLSLLVGVVSFQMGAMLACHNYWHWAVYHIEKVRTISFPYISPGFPERSDDARTLSKIFGQLPSISEGNVLMNCDVCQMKGCQALKLMFEPVHLVVSYSVCVVY